MLSNTVSTAVAQ